VVLVMRRWRHRRQDDRGVTLVLCALLLTTMLGMAAFVVDYGFARQASRNEQGASDAAALAGAQDLPRGTTANAAMANAARANARSYVIESLGESITGAPCAANVATCTFTVGDHDITITTPYVLSGSTIPSHNLIYIQACRVIPKFFAGVYGDGEQTVCRSSVARNRNIVAGFGRGLIALNPTACPALEFDGSSTTNLYSDGAIIVESSCTPNALDGGGNAWEVQAGLITVVGGYQINPCNVSSCLNGTTPVTGVAPTGDPLALVPEPARPAAALPRTNGGGTSPFGGACQHTYHPGFYTTISVNSRNSCFDPGLYYIEAGSATAEALGSNGSSFLHGQGVTFFIKRGDIRLNGSGSMRLTPPTTGPYAGITIFQSRTNCAAAKINGNDASSIGTIYLPCAHLDFQGNAGPTAGDFVTGMVIADTIQITGNGTLTINAEEPAVVVPPEDDIGLEH
jgi:Putative Flp pilus-assembly TadE/G-like